MSDERADDAGIVERFALPAVLTAVGFGLRLAEMRDYWISADEGLRHFIARAPIAEAVELVLANAHPPLFAALLRLLAPLGDGIFWLRTPSLVCGTLAIPVVYAAGRRLAGPVAGGIAAALLAFSPAAISMSQVARPYGLQLLLVSGVIATWLRAIDRRRARDLWVYSALATAALLAHYGSLIAIAATLAGFAAERVRTGAFSFPARDLAKAQLPVFAVLALLFAVHIGPRLWGSPLRVDAVETWLAPYFGATAGGLWRNALGVFAYLAGPALGGTCALSFAIAWGIGARGGGSAARAAWLCAAAFAVGMLLSATSLYPFGGTRHVTVLAPFVCLVAGVGVQRLVARGPLTVAAGTAVLTLWALFGAPIERALAMPRRGAATYPELQIAREEGEWARAQLEALSGTPGVLVTDRSTAFTLAPVFGDALAEAKPLGAGEVDAFTWGQRDVRMVGRWLLRVGPDAHPREAHLETALEAAPIAIGTEVSVLVSQGREIVSGFAALTRGGSSQRAGVLGIEGKGHFQRLEIDPARYRAAIASARRLEGR